MPVGTRMSKGTRAATGLMNLKSLARRIVGKPHPLVDFDWAGRRRWKKALEVGDSFHFWSALRKIHPIYLVATTKMCGFQLDEARLLRYCPSDGNAYLHSG